MEYEPGFAAQVPLTRLVATMFPVALVTTLSWFGVFTFVNGYMIHSLGCTNRQWAATTLWLVGGMLVWQFVLTGIASMLGRRRTVTLSLASVGVGYLGIAFAKTPLQIGLLLAVMGISQAAGAVVWFPILAEAGGDKPGRAMALNMMVGMLVGVATLSLGGQLVSRIDYSTAFLLFGGLGLGCAVAFRILSKPLQSRPTLPVVALHHLSREDLRQLFKPAFLTVLLAGIALEPFNYHTVNQLFPNLARDAHGMSENTISQVVAFGRLPSLAALFLFAMFIDRLTPRRWYGLGLLCCALTVVAMGRSHSAAAVTACYLSFYLFHGIVWSCNSTSINVAVEPRLRDSAFAVVALAANGAILLIGTMQKDLIGAGASLPQVFILCGCAGCIAGLTLIAFSFRGRRIERAILPGNPAAAESV